MRMFGRVSDTMPEPETIPADDPAVDVAEPVDETAAVRAEAEQARSEAAEQRGEAEKLVEAARAEAARLVAEAERQARDLMNESRNIDRRAEKLEERLSYLVHAEQLRDRITEAEQQAAVLEAEAGALDEQIEALAGRLEELGVQREDATSALSAARDAGDVAGVQQQRAQLAAVDEVVKALTGQREALEGRLQAIGGPADPAGELARTLARAEAARMELRRTLNILDPERTEAQVDELLATLNGALEAQFAEVAPPSTPRRTLNVQHTPAIQEPPVTVNKSTPKIDQLRKASSKAKAEDQVGVYDVNGNLIGICDPDTIVPIAQMGDVEKQTLATAVFKGIRQRPQR